MTKSRKEEDEHTIDEAIAYLANYNPTACWEGAEAHFERWVAETKRAHEWMLDYREKHFNVNV
jgi:ferric-dicitrate binding protein FerR (iron transport regulator)